MEKIKIRIQADNAGGALLESVPYFLILALMFLLPVFFIPSSLISFSYSKVILLAIVTLLSFFAWIITVFKSGKLVLPVNWIFLAALLIPIIFFVSALFSPNRHSALFGNGSEIGTASFILLLIILFLLSVTFIRNKERIFYCYIWFGAGFLLVALYQLIHLFFGPNVLSFNYFLDVTSSPVGNWSDLAVFSGAATLLSLISLELLSLSRPAKTLFYIILVAGLVLLAFSNFSIIWNTPISVITLIGVFALILFVYLLSFGRTTKDESLSKRLPIPSLIVFIFAVIFTLPPTIPYLNTSYLDTRFNISNVQVNPTWQATFTVAGDALHHNPLLGTGPNRFSSEWSLAKPAGVNTTDFWGTDFSYGVGLLPTFLVTSGILGILAWLIFLGLFIYLGRTLWKGTSDRFSLYLLISSFSIALYFWIMNILYVPSAVNLAFSFIFSGLFLASLFREGLLSQKSVSYVEDSRKGFAVILLMVFLVIGIIAWGYLLTSKVLAAVYANKAALQLNGGDAAGAEASLVRALGLDKESEYYRLLSQVELTQMNNLLQSGNLNSDTSKTSFQNFLNNASVAASSATTLDPTDYQNWVGLGEVYSTVVPLGVSNAYSQALSAYQEALKRNPKNPGIYLLMAELEVNNKDADKAKADILSALQLKNNYVDPLYLLSQIDLSLGNNQAAVTDLEAAVSIAPTNANTYFELGTLNYNLGNYNDAVSAFKQALIIIPQYADAKYYLGLSYYRLGEIAQAVEEFQELSNANPNDQTLPVILANLKAGRDPLFNLGSSSSTSAAVASSSASKTK